MKIILFLICCCACILCEAQSVKRQSIGTLGTTHYSEEYTIQQSAGQPFKTNTYYNDSSGYLPGFIQPNVYKASFVSSSSLISIDVFPNPASETVSFIAEKNLENLVIDIYDLTGKLILQEKILQLQSYVLDCEQWSSGLYLLSLRDNKGNLYHFKLIKSK